MPAKYETVLTILKTRLISITVIFIFLLNGCSFTSTAPFPDASNDASTLDWQECGDNFQCATLDVPIDYSDAALGRFDIALIRYRSPNQRDRIGSLVINPGGPGVGGIEYAKSAEYIFSPDLLERYDIVGFDPRGVGASAPITCLTDSEQDAALEGDPKPDNEREFAQALADTQSFIDKCLVKTANLAHYSTVNTARDMDVMRQGLGEPALNFFGFSYGTYLGTLYAQLFPENVGRFVLDGAINPIISSEQQSLVQAVAFDKAITNFIADCAQKKNCPLPANSTSRFFTDLFKKVSLQPLIVKAQQSAQSPRVITESLVVIGTASALYDDVSGWPALRTAIAQALQGDGTGYAQLADSYNGRKSDGTYRDNQNDSNIIINCLDWPNNPSNENIRSNVQNFIKAAPVFGPYVAYSGITCNLLRAKIDPKSLLSHAPKDDQRQIKKTATPVLIIGTTQDPATPYEWAKALAGYIKGSRLITLTGEGHTGYGRGSACTDDAIDAYLITGVIPASDLTCRQ